MHAFDFNAAFSRNLGWVTGQEQGVLRNSRVAIAGLGGVGGFHLLTLVRLGVGSFNLADFDTFDLANFNRQAGASLDTLGKPKLEVMAKMARDINPEVDIRPFPDGVDEGGLDDFLADVDLYVDGLDFFALDIRQAVFAACARKNIPAITVAPLGMGAALLNFLPGQMTFEDYFGFAQNNQLEKAIRFFVGLAPARLHMGYLVDPSTIDLANHKGPSTAMGCMLCAGVAGTEVLKILLHRGRVYSAPWGVHYDAFHNKLARTWRPGGNNRNPLQQFALSMVRRRLHAK
jgi:sulfur-carrier protein adenylyltransferase/sulfurtransferase